MRRPPKRLKKLIFIALTFIISCIPLRHSLAEKEKKISNISWPLTTFPKLKEGDTMETFMKKVSNMLQNRLINVPQMISYIDKNGVVSDESKKLYVEEVKKNIIKRQKNLFSNYDTNLDEVITLKEIADKNKIDIDLVEALYKTSKAYNQQAVDEIDKIYRAIIKSKAPVHPNSFFMSIIRPFTVLDLNADMSISKSELENAAQENVDKITVEVLKEFSALKSLQSNSSPVSINTISDKAIETFKHFDLDGSNKISYNEYLLYHYSRRSETDKIIRKDCNLPNLEESGIPTYAIILSNSPISTSYKFSSISEDTNYAEIEIEKQNVPINLLLMSHAHMIWNIKGDTQSINKVILFGQGTEDKELDSFIQTQDPYLDEEKWPSSGKAFPSKEITTAVSGVRKDKIQFSDINYCVYLENLNDYNQISEKERLNRQKKNEYEIGVAVGLKKPDILKTQYSASHIRIKTKPEIIFDSKKIVGSKDKPEGMKKEYWNMFLKTNPLGHKFVDPKTFISGTSYKLNSPYYPVWGGLAQLEKEGIIEELKFDKENRKVIFLLKKDLPIFMGMYRSNPWNITMIADNNSINLPYAENTLSAMNYCIFSRSGDYLFGDEGRCNKNDMGILKKETSIAENSNKVYLRLDKFLPTLTSEHDSFDISLRIDKNRCEKEYGQDYKEKCIIPDSLRQKGALDYALSIEPSRNGKLTWKDNSTLTFTIDNKSRWDYNEMYNLSLDLGKNIIINGKEIGKSIFIPAGPFYEISNLKIIPYDLYPDSKIVTADITSNYDFEGIDNINICHTPIGSITPDTFFIQNSDCEPLSTEEPIDDLTFEMKDGKGHLKIILTENPKSLSKTYLRLIGTNRGSGFGTTIAYFEDPEDKKSFSPEINSLITKAQKGDATSQLELGIKYLKGEKLEKSLYRARKWLNLAAKQDLQSAWVELGKFYMIKGPDTENYVNTRAFYWLTKAANLGNAEAQYYLGLLHADKQSSYYDGTLSLFWITKSGEKNYIPALLKLGKIYEEGFETEFGLVAKQDYKISLKFYTQASNLGSIEGTANVAKYYYLGDGVEEDYTKAYDLAKKAILNSTRNDLPIRDIAGKIVAEILIKQLKYPLISNPDDIKTSRIIDRIFSEFPKDYMRIWIASTMPVIVDTIVQQEITFDLPIAEGIANRQLKETPNLPELKLLQALILLNKGNSHKMNAFNVYEEKVVKKVITLLEPLVNDPVLDNDAIYILAECYASNNQKNKLLKLSEYATFQRYFTTFEIAKAFGRSFEALGDRDSLITALNFYSISGDVQGFERTNYRISDNPERYLKELQKNIKNHPNQIIPLVEYASFLYHIKGDYEQAIIASLRALKLNKNNREARWIGGVAYLAKASQIFKKEGLSSEVRKYINTAKMLGLSKWCAMLQCGLYCNDIAHLLDDYYTKISVEKGKDMMNKKNEEIRDIYEKDNKNLPL